MPVIEISFVTGSLAVLFGWLLYRGCAYYRCNRVDWKYEAKQIFFLINLLVIYRFTFHPFSKVDGQVQPLIFEWATAWPFRVNLVPFVNLLDYPTRGEILLNVIGNSTMFIPTGILIPLLYRNRNSFPKTVLTGFWISLTIEILQLPFAVRCSDVDDLILNTLGCMAGYGIVTLCRRK